METAAQLLDLGYKPIIIEKSDHLGGHVADWNRLFPDMSPAADVVRSLASRVSGANIFLNTEISFINKLKDSYNIMLSNGISIVTRIIVMATGFDLFDASKKEEYGYGVYDQVMTNKDLEHWFNTGDDPRINDSAMNAVGFVHCVGSRDEKARNTQCSKVCCITAVKQAIELKQKFPDAMIYCFYMDLRMFGKKYEDFYIGAQRDYGIRFIRGRVSEVSENIDGRVIVKAHAVRKACKGDTRPAGAYVRHGMQSGQHESGEHGPASDRYRRIPEVEGQCHGYHRVPERRGFLCGSMHWSEDSP